MNQKQRAKWEKIRAKGLLRFVLIEGILWGVYMTTALTIADRFFGSGSYHLEFIYRKLFIGVLLGFLVAFTAWHRNEWKYEMSQIKSNERI